MSSERISLETRNDFGKIDGSVRRSYRAWRLTPLGLIPIGISALFFAREVTAIVASAELIFVGGYQFAEGRIQEAYSGRINRRGDAQLARRYGNLSEPLPDSEAKMVLKLSRPKRTVKRLSPKRKFVRIDSKD